VDPKAITQPPGESRTIKFLAWWAVNRKWIVGTGVVALVLSLLLAGLVHHINQVKEQNRFVPTPTVNVLLDRKTLKECWAGDVAYETPHDVMQENIAAADALSKTKYGTPEADAAYERSSKAWERLQYYDAHPAQGTKIFVRHLPYCSDLRAETAQSLP
jgi:hypothetical protein